MYDLRQEHMRSLIRGIWEADGDTVNDTPLISTASALFRDQLLVLCLKAGYQVHYALKSAAGESRTDGQVVKHDYWEIRYYDGVSAHQQALIDPMTDIHDHSRGESAEYQINPDRTQLPANPFIWYRRAHFHVRTSRSRHADDDEILPTTTKASKPILVRLENKRLYHCRM